MVRRVKQNTDNSQCRLLTIQRLHDSKWRVKRGEMRLRKRREAYRAIRDRESEEEWQTRL